MKEREREEKGGKKQGGMADDHKSLTEVRKEGKVRTNGVKKAREKCGMPGTDENRSVGMPRCVRGLHVKFVKIASYEVKSLISVIYSR